MIKLNDLSDATCNFLMLLSVCRHCARECLKVPCKWKHITYPAVKACNIVYIFHVSICLYSICSIWHIRRSAISVICAVSFRNFSKLALSDQTELKARDQLHGVESAGTFRRFDDSIHRNSSLIWLNLSLDSLDSIDSIVDLTSKSCNSSFLCFCWKK